MDADLSVAPTCPSLRPAIFHSLSTLCSRQFTSNQGQGYVATRKSWQQAFITHRPFGQLERTTEFSNEHGHIVCSHSSMHERTYACQHHVCIPVGSSICNWQPVVNFRPKLAA
ncbi:unnamed protein product, partial [Protopolystoma xenopodis]